MYLTEQSLKNFIRTRMSETDYTIADLLADIDVGNIPKADIQDQVFETVRNLTDIADKEICRLKEEIIILQRGLYGTRS